MTDHITIPPEALEAAARTLCRQDGRLPDVTVGPDGMRGFLAWEAYKPSARAACLAMLRSWPGMAYRYRMSVSLEPQEIVLPLPQEPTND